MRRFLKMPWVRAVSALSVVSVFFLISVGSESIVSKAKPDVGELDCSPDFGIINGEPDAGVRLSFRIRNVGEEGVIEVLPRLSTSEGEWRRSQTLQFGAGESQRLSYFFPEPTVNATNIHCYVKTIPGP